MRTDRELTALFADAIADEQPDPTFLDNLFEVLVQEVATVKIPGSVGSTTTTRVVPRIERLGRRLPTGGGRLVTRPLAVAAAIVVVVVTGAIIVGSRAQFGSVGGPTSSPVPSSTPAATWQVAPSASFSSFTSTTYSYTVGYPSNWKTHESPGRLDANSYPYDFSGGVDYLSATSPDVLDPGLIIAGPRLTRPMDLAAWMANIAQLSATNIACAAPDATESTTVAGLPAQIDTWQACPEYVLWAGFVRGGVGYHVLLIDEFATDNPTLQAADHAMFLRILGTFSFTGPVETLAPSAAPSATGSRSVAPSAS